jgi:hypothetical protein
MLTEMCEEFFHSFSLIECLENRGCPFMPSQENLNRSTSALKIRQLDYMVVAQVLGA